MTYNTNLQNISTLLKSVNDIEFFYFENEYIESSENKEKFVSDLIIYSEKSNILKTISNIFKKLPKTTIKLLNNQKPIRFKIEIYK